MALRHALAGRSSPGNPGTPGSITSAQSQAPRRRPNGSDHLRRTITSITSTGPAVPCSGQIAIGGSMLLANDDTFTHNTDFTIQVTYYGPVRWDRTISWNRRGLGSSWRRFPIRRATRPPTAGPA